MKFDMLAVLNSSVCCVFPAGKQCKSDESRCGLQALFNEGAINMVSLSRPEAQVEGEEEITRGR